ncbi:hypothetical protein N7478_004016 [Penicillium angulare]|uniref:uncharacterized protein n=1 Tax=Penicillium angulare TaxID=116970 RepID=UPI0025421875|nr:uncharacterized protein N7478_004016 [Penicillium angulare]KAJ5278644.1 hypothetical protein N7478_004016 [Penicillium angulare]
MPKVLILGATGYLGRQVANQFIQTGQHTVYGIARTETKARFLASQEIRPVICADPVNDPEPYLSIIRSKNIDLVVDVTNAGPGSYKILQQLSIVGQERLESYKKRGTRGPKLGFIYCSGTWVHGSSSEAINDLDLVGPDTKAPPVELVAWRVDLESAVLNAHDVIYVMILRPGMIYGREGPLWSPFFMPVLTAAKNDSKEPVELPLDSNTKAGHIHVDDAARAFVNAAENLAMVSGSGVYPVFDLVTSHESMRDIFNALVVTCRFQGKVILKGHGGDLFTEAMRTSFRGSSARAKQVLGWKPMRLEGYANDMDVFVAAMQAK